MKETYYPIQGKVQKVRWRDYAPLAVLLLLIGLALVPVFGWNALAAALVGILIAASVVLFGRGSGSGDVLSLKDAQQRVFGSPASHLDQASVKFGMENVRKGIQGEQRTATLLSEWVEGIPGVRVFHSMRFPAAMTDADVDHIIVSGNNVLIIDSKMWGRGRYAWAEDGRHVWTYSPAGTRQAEPYARSVNSIVDAIDGYQDILGNHAMVQGYLALHSETPQQISVLGDPCGPAGVILARAEDAIPAIADWLRRVNPDGIVDRRLLYTIKQWQKR